MKKKPEPAEASREDVEIVAVRLLARREHSQLELHRKLLKRGFRKALIEEVIGDLAQTGRQSDRRYVDSYIYARSQKGFGPVRLVNELRERGIDEVMAYASQEMQETDWQTIACREYRKKYGNKETKDLRERIRREQFLRYRGFTQEQIRFAMRTYENNC